MKTFELWATRDEDGEMTLWPKEGKPKLSGMMWQNELQDEVRFQAIDEPEIFGLENIGFGQISKLLRFTVEEVTK